MRLFLKRVSEDHLAIRSGIPVLVSYLHYILYNTPLNNLGVAKPFFKFENFLMFYISVVILVAIINGLSNGWKYFLISLLAVPAILAGVAILGIFIFFLLITFGGGLGI